MVRLGYKLMPEEHGPAALVANAGRAEEAGVDFAAISDPCFPWLEEQGHAPFAWSVLGAIAQATRRMGLMTAVTCPIMRYHVSDDERSGACARHASWRADAYRINSQQPAAAGRRESEDSRQLFSPEGATVDALGWPIEETRDAGPGPDGGTGRSRSRLSSGPVDFGA